jgi:hypothetical protein
VRVVRQNPPDDDDVAPEAVRPTKTIVARLCEVSGAFWEIGQVLGRIRDERLYAAMHYESSRAYVDGELSVVATQAYMMIRIVRSYTRADAEALGLERAAGLITYAKTVGGGVEPGRLVREDLPVGGKTARSASLRDIQAAARAEREAKRKKLRASPAARRLQKEATRIAAGLRAIHRGAALGRGAIEVREDEVLVRFSRRTLAQRFRG